ncbi:hypothetical protein F5984_06785 [Rudanella paleaurantiibacter]|uniref:Uncharacterized protein n=1 Tax=Rudanella paleaurantiibacter TaxID=2614655 RepID=A0A7J5U2L8_9BACT|nr:PriCT-2 domain-containing protein [Rudanella paleaurantiibacter]KAB7731921.1 hypothetical protein F5984_06785 [Rudanella paleaurantiibacter]
MPQQLHTISLLETEVSSFRNLNTADNPKPIRLLTWLRSVKYRDRVEQIRTIEDKKQRDEQKGLLPIITPSGVFTYREESKLVRHTGLLQFDIDLTDNKHIRNYVDLKNQIAKLPFVAYCGLSTSGKGYWGLVPIASPKRHAQHFDALVRVFAHYKIKLDTRPRNVASARCYSHDPAAYLPEKVQLFELFDIPKPSPRRKFYHTVDADKDRHRVEICIAEILRRGQYIETYRDWYEVGCAFANSYGEGGRNYFHHVSQNYPKYSANETDKQFSACLKGKSKATLGSFFHFCERLGIRWKDLLAAPISPTPPHRLKPAQQFPESPVIYQEPERTRRRATNVQAEAFAMEKAFWSKDWTRPPLKLTNRPEPLPVRPSSRTQGDIQKAVIDMFGKNQHLAQLAKSFGAELVGVRRLPTVPTEPVPGVPASLQYIAQKNDDLPF